MSQPTEDVADELMAVLSRVLQRPVLDRDESFARLGGTSLAAVHAVTMIQQRWNIDLPLLDFLDAPSIGAIAILVARDLER